MSDGMRDFWMASEAEVIALAPKAPWLRRPNLVRAIFAALRGLWKRK